MKKIITLTLLSMVFTAHANNISRFQEDVEEFSFTASDSSMTITNKSNGKVTKVKGEGCSAYTEERNGKILIIVTSNLKYVRLEGSNLKYNKLVSQYTMEQSNGDETEKVRFLVGSGYYLSMTASYENSSIKEEIKCAFKHRSKINK